MRMMMLALVAFLFVTVRATAAEDFPISFWYGPPAAANTVETWRRVADAHFTIAGPCYPYSLADNRTLLDCCRRTGLRALVVDARVGPEMIADKGWPGTVRQVVADYADAPALYGYFLQDEPSARWFEALGEIHAEFRKCDPRHAPFVNLFPSYATPAIRGTTTQREYLHQFVQTVRPVLFSYDHYPFLNDGEDRSDYFENLESVREASGAGQAPFWSVVQAASFESCRDPAPGELQWQVYTSLAYGAKGICYFTYWPVPQLVASAIVDSEGKPTARYETVRELNRRVLAIGPTLLALRSTAVYHTGEIPSGCRRLSSEAAVQVPGDKSLLVGCFEDAAKNELVMIVNRDYRASQQFDVEVKSHVDSVTSIGEAPGAPSEVTLEQRRFSLRLESGEGRLFQLRTRAAAGKPFAIMREINFDFLADDDDWSAEHSLEAPVIEQGILRSAISGPDPYFTRKLLVITPDRYSRIVVKMKSPGSMAQFYWQTAASRQFDDTRHVDFATIADGKFHEYVIRLSDHAGWKGHEIRAIRLDPAADDVSETTRDRDVEIDWIRGEK